MEVFEVTGIKTEPKPPKHFVRMTRPSQDQPAGKTDMRRHFYDRQGGRGRPQLCNEQIALTTEHAVIMAFKLENRISRHAARRTPNQ